MTTLDQAFIQAFAKNRPGHPRESTRPSQAAETCPASAKDSAARLVLHNIYTHGGQLRFDLDTSAKSEQDSVSLAAHVAFPTDQSMPAATSCDRSSTDRDTRNATLTPPRRCQANRSDAPATDRWVESVDPADDKRPHEAPKPDPSLCEPLAWNVVTGSHACSASKSLLAWQAWVEPPAELPAAFLVKSSPELSETGQVADQLAELGEFLMGHRTTCPSLHALTTGQTAADVPPPEPFGGDRNEGSDPQSAESSNSTRATEAADVDAPTAWEVDQFRWPVLCGKLLEASGGEIHEAGNQLMAASGEGLKILAVTGTQPGEGRSTLALALATGVAQAGGRVALLDADIASPDLAIQLGIDVPCDWLEVASQQQPILEAGVASLKDKITLFPLASAHQGPIDSRLFHAVLDQLRSHFDLIVVDMSPITRQDAGVLQDATASPINMAVVVHNPKVSTQEETVAVAGQLREMGILAIGIAENSITGHAIRTASSTFC